MSTTVFPCGCKVEYDDRTDEAILIYYCRKHKDLENKKISTSLNAANLEDAIFDDYTDTVYDDLTFEGLD